MTIVITDRWGNETEEPDDALLNKTFDDLFLDNILLDISITDGNYHFDINKNGWIYLSDDENTYYMKNVAVENIRQLWKQFHEGHISDILAEPWIKGIPAFNGDY